MIAQNFIFCKLATKKILFPTSVKRSRIFEIGEKIGEALKNTNLFFQKRKRCFSFFMLLGVALSLGRGRREHIYGGLVPHTPGVFKKQKEKGYKERFYPFWFLPYIYIIIY